MATIKEMAINSFPDHPTNEELTRSRKLRRAGYEIGANAVLDLLQKRLSDRHFTSAAFLQMDIEDFINELKML